MKLNPFPPSLIPCSSELALHIQTLSLFSSSLLCGPCDEIIGRFKFPGLSPGSDAWKRTRKQEGEVGIILDSWGSRRLRLLQPPYKDDSCVMSANKENPKALQALMQCVEWGHSPKQEAAPLQPHTQHLSWTDQSDKEEIVVTWCNFSSMRVALSSFILIRKINSDTSHFGTFYSANSNQIKVGLWSILGRDHTFGKGRSRW